MSRIPQPEEPEYGAPYEKIPFGMAVEALKNERWIRRDIWPKGLHLYREDHLGYTVGAGKFKGTTIKYAPTICVFNDADPVRLAGWTPTAGDMFAEDWQVIPYEDMR